MSKRLLKDFKKNKPKLYYRCTTENYTYILINRYDNDVNVAAIADDFTVQYRDITFGASNNKIIDFIAQIEDMGYMRDQSVLLVQLIKEGKTDILNKNRRELIDWLIGENDLIF